METAIGSMSDDQMNSLMQMGDPFGAEEEDEEEIEIAGDVRTTLLDALQLRKGQNFLYLFDYGDEWQFNVRVQAINDNADTDVEYPRIVESVGQAPEQYPDWEDEEEGWEEEEEDNK